MTNCSHSHSCQSLYVSLVLQRMADAHQGSTRHAAPGTPAHQQRQLNSQQQQPHFIKTSHHANGCRCLQSAALESAPLGRMTATPPNLAHSVAFAGGRCFGMCDRPDSARMIFTFVMWPTVSYFSITLHGHACSHRRPVHSDRRHQLADVRLSCE